MKLNVDNLMKNSFVISINELQYAEFQKRFQKEFGENIPKRFQGYTIPNKIYKDAGLIKTSNIINCSLSHINLIKMAKCLNFPYICIFEDDACPQNNIRSTLQNYLDEIPDNIDMLKIGYTDIIRTISSFSSKLLISETIGSHSYIIFERYYDSYITNMNKDIVADSLVMNDKSKVIFTLNKPLFIQNNINTKDALHKERPNLRIRNIYSDIELRNLFNINL